MSVNEYEVSLGAMKMFRSQCDAVTIPKQSCVLRRGEL